MSPAQPAQITTVEEYDELMERAAEAFFRSYELQRVLMHPAEGVPKMRRPEVVGPCRYCHPTQQGGASFSEAHVISAQLGNAKLVSYEECDGCNRTFSVYERHLGDFLGPLKAIADVEGRHGVPSFANPQTDTWVGQTAAGLVIRTDVKHSAPEAHVDGTRTFSIESRSYVPLLVWKALARSAVHLFGPGDRDRFEWFREVVLSDSRDAELDRILGFCRTYVTKLVAHANVFKDPVVELYRRRDGAFELGQIMPAKVLVIKAMSIVFQVFIFDDHDIKALSPSDDEAMAGGGNPRTVHLQRYPVLGLQIPELGPPTFEPIDLNSLTPTRHTESFRLIPPAGSTLTESALTEAQMQKAGLHPQYIQELLKGGINGPGAFDQIVALSRASSDATVVHEGGDERPEPPPHNPAVSPGSDGLSVGDDSKAT